MKSQNFFPAVGANGPSIVHVNFGQAGFVFIEANVKKWGLAPMTGSLAPPPPYGSEQGSILLEAGRKDGYTGSHGRGHGYSHSTLTYTRHGSGQEQGHSRTRSGNFRVLPPTSPGPIRSPTDISLAHLVPTDDAAEASTSTAAGATQHIQTYPTAGLGLHDTHNPPPPEYTSPEPSEAGDGGSRRNSSDSENAPLINLSRSRGGSLATVRAIPTNTSRNAQQGPPSPPIPSYQDAVQQGAGRDRSDSARSSRSTR